MKREYLILKEEDERCSSIETLKNLLKTDENISISEEEIKYNEYIVKYKIEQNKIKAKREIIFKLLLESSAPNTDNNSIENIEKISRKIREILKQSNNEFLVVEILDEISQYHCQKGYKSVNEIENLMRKLIFKFMLKNLGMSWIKETIPEELKSKLKSNAIKHKNDSEFEEKILFEAEFMQLREFLFTEYTTVKSVKEMFDKLEDIKNIEELEKFKELKHKSNWDKYFSESYSEAEKKIINDEWNKLSEYRNIIAHNKQFSSKDYEDFLKIADKITHQLNLMIEKIDTIEVPEDDIEELIEIGNTMVTKENDINKLLDGLSKIDSNELFKVFNEAKKVPFNLELNAKTLTAMNSIQNMIKNTPSKQMIDILQRSINSYPSAKMLAQIGKNSLIASNIYKISNKLEEEK